MRERFDLIVWQSAPQTVSKSAAASCPFVRKQREGANDAVSMAAFTVFDKLDVSVASVGGVAGYSQNRQPKLRAS
jgi:hypothetical protein